MDYCASAGLKLVFPERALQQTMPQWWRLPDIINIFREIFAHMMPPLREGYGLTIIKLLSIRYVYIC